MTYNFTSKTSRAIQTEFMAIIDNKGTAVDIDNAFDALKAATPQVQRRVVDDLEDKMIEQVALATMAIALGEMSSALDGDDFGDDDFDDDEEFDEDVMLDEEMLQELEVLKPLVQALARIAQIKGKDAQPQTKAYAKAFNRLTATEKESVEALAKCLYDVAQKVDTAPSGINGAVAGIHYTLFVSGAAAAIAEVEKITDNYTRERLIDRLDEIQVQNINLAVEAAKKTTPEQLTKMANPKAVKTMQNNLAFSTYVANAKGAAADPLLRVYVAIAARLTDQQLSDYTVLSTTLPISAAIRLAQIKEQALKNQGKPKGPGF